MAALSTALQETFAKVLPATLVAIYRQKGKLGQREFSTAAEAIDWIEVTAGITWLHLLDQTTGRLVLTARPPLGRTEPVIRPRPLVQLINLPHDERGRYRFEMHAENPPFRVIGEHYASRGERDDAAEGIARLLHVELTTSQQEDS